MLFSLRVVMIVVALIGGTQGSLTSLPSMSMNAFRGAGAIKGGSFTVPTAHQTPFDPHDGPGGHFAVMDKDRIGNPLVHQVQRSRPRRNRKSAAIRSMVREHTVSPSNFIYPIFIQEASSFGSKHRSSGSGGLKEPIASMPGIHRHDLDSMMREVAESVTLGIRAFALFPRIQDSLKTNLGEEAFNPTGLVPRAIRRIKSAFPDVTIMTDVALDPYSSMGHDGVVIDGKIVNDLTVQQLQKQAVMHARAGADVVAPSDMMDGRVGAIRDALDSEGFTDVSILAYTAKYASAFYGPFRDALHSHPGFGDKKSYQMDPANRREAYAEAALDVAEGADIIMVKPGMPYLDVIQRLHSSTNVPVAAYQVSGEYAMLKAAAKNGWLDEKASVMESMLCFKRAGADLIFTYYAKECARWMRDKLVGGDKE